jgi:hypothetical protein
MSHPPASRPQPDPAATLLGYLNFSSGAFDPSAWQAINALYAEIEPDGPDGPGGPTEDPGAAAAVAARLQTKLAELSRETPAFRDASQAQAVTEILFTRLPLAYREFHADLLAHQPPGSLERPFFMMAAARAVLATGGPWSETQAVLDRAIGSLNDYVGWRPLAVLENGRLSEPYPHERIRPLPLYVAGAGVAHGRYAWLVSGALAILAEAPASLVGEADFDLSMLEELSIDTRAFDFLHPAASRPNYLFGLWDPARIDEQGWYRRLVVQQATLEGIRTWGEVDRDDATLRCQRQYEASAVLAGVMLMAAGLSGHGPGAPQAALPLAELLPRIAGYRDAFYRWLLDRLEPGHRQRLEQEMRQLRQPFGGVRRHINGLLAAQRARQVESVALASVFARLGRGEAAERMAHRVPAASARMVSRVMGRTVAAEQAVAEGRIAEGLDLLDEAVELLFRAVACGAAVDPWNILGLAGQFPLHEPGGESLPDPRVDDLVSMTAAILEGMAGCWRTAALAGETALAARAEGGLERFAGWWDRHATTSVSGVPQVSGKEIVDSTREVIASLGRRRASGESPPAPGFWRREVAGFSSTRCHAEAAASLVGEGDLDGAMGLVVHWASLLEGDLLERSGEEWLEAAEAWLARSLADEKPTGRARQRRFLELVEANTSAVADVIERGGVDPREWSGSDAAAGDEEADDENVAAAYESMVWRDSADDGTEGGMLEAGTPGGDAADEAMESLGEAAEFLAGVSELVRRTVVVWIREDARAGRRAEEAEIDSVAGWRHFFRRLRHAMVRAAAGLVQQAGEPTGTDGEDASRLARDAAAERLLESAVRISETNWILSAHRVVNHRRGAAASSAVIGSTFAALLTGDRAAARAAVARLHESLADRRVLYVPLSRGGRPDRIVAARGRERLLAKVAACLPRLGLVHETVETVRLAKSLEQHRPPGVASVSEFDRVFESATLALVERICESARESVPESADGDSEASRRMLEGLALTVPKLLETWMVHARQLRLSVLERMRDDRVFAAVREFVEEHGRGLFTQHLLAPASLRGILRRGVRPWLESLVERAEFGNEADLLPPLVGRIAAGEVSLRQAAARIRIVLESIAENHAEYRDWNSTTTQSDRGDCLHILLDFLRVKAEYDRVAWTLRPVGMAHRVLSSRGEQAAAAAWRERMREETESTAAGIRRRLAEAEQQWGLRLASVADRVSRPFTAVLEQDELESLVETTVRELRRGEAGPAGDLLEKRAEALLGVAAGSGVEVPEWLERLGRRVDTAAERTEAAGADSLPDAIPWQRLSWESLLASLDEGDGLPSAG